MSKSGGAMAPFGPLLPTLLPIKSRLPQVSSGALSVPQTKIANFCFAIGLRVAGGLRLRDRGSGTKGLGLRDCVNLV